MREIKLRECPFCGGINMTDTYNNFVPALLCCDCGAMMTIPMVKFGTSYKRILAEKWNTRKPMDRIVERLQKKSFMVATSKEFYDNPQKGDYVETVVTLDDAIEIVKAGGVDGI